MKAQSPGDRRETSGISFVEHLLPLTCPHVLGLLEKKILCWDIQTQIALGCWGGAYRQHPLQINNFLSPDSQPNFPIHSDEGIGSKSFPIRLGTPYGEEVNHMTVSSQRTEAKTPLVFRLGLL